MQLAPLQLGAWAMENARDEDGNTSLHMALRVAGDLDQVLSRWYVESLRARGKHFFGSGPVTNGLWEKRSWDAEAKEIKARLSTAMVLNRRNLKVANRWGETPLHLASALARAPFDISEVITTLCGAGADVNAVDTRTGVPRCTWRQSQRYTSPIVRRIRRCGNNRRRWSSCW
jgi:hypothetical protein